MKILTAVSLAMLLSALAAAPAQAGAIHDANLFTTELAANDDGYTGLVDLCFTANINGTNYTQTYVNNNGNITFTNALGTYTPSAIENGAFGPIIAPFFADVDTRSSNSDVVSYGCSTLGGRNVFGVNYINVGVYPVQDIFNDFQMILTDRSDVAPGDFDIQFNYDRILWEAGTASAAPPGGLCNDDVNYPNCVSALAGYWTSDSSNATLPGSLIHGALVDGGIYALISNSLNSEILGQYNFQVRNGTVLPPGPPTDVPEPGTLALFGLALAGLGLSRRRKTN